MLVGTTYIYVRTKNKRTFQTVFVSTQESNINGSLIDNQNDFYGTSETGIDVDENPHKDDVDMFDQKISFYGVYRKSNQNCGIFRIFMNRVDYNQKSVLPT